MERKDFYVFRHGQTDSNKSQLWCGFKSNIDLNDEGRQQAADLAERLKPKNLQLIVSSPLVRALSTSRIVAEKISSPLVVEENLKEVFYGDVEGMPTHEVWERYPEIAQANYYPKKDKLHLCFPQGESLIDVDKRVMAVFSKLLKYQLQSVGVGMHAGNIGVLLSRFDVDYTIKNCSFVHLYFEDGAWHLENGVF